MIVADSSAILAHIFSEQGGEWFDTEDRDIVISTVNVTEVVSKLLERGWALQEAVDDLEMLGLRAAEHSVHHAYGAAALQAVTRHKGLSLGDRACLALAIRENATVFTADRDWADLDVGCTIELIR
ncbi:type II toxin-antitoxin system VapC family toxin [Aquamicrobium sp. LC103]|uniref:type II toxin-antitoxin system VapC family toxin n=1 Tax=Aquamicrobium sp. LC103 TaxID=1120658 RepID=UPI000AA13672|nr:type II toxin-antitoxin system VapC family toxin [Aquamicrobium sp. LC103]